jgi:hypothetical protein
LKEERKKMVKKMRLTKLEEKKKMVIVFVVAGIVAFASFVSALFAVASRM